MDPIMMAARKFADGVCAFLRSKRTRTLRISSVPEDHNSVIGVLRLIERAPDNHRPFFLYEEPFTAEEPYFTGLVAKIVADYGRLGGPPLRLSSEGGGLERAALSVARVHELLRREVLVGLVPRNGADAPAFREALRVWTALPFPPGVKLVVPDAGIGDVSARFAVDPEGLRRFVAATARDAGALRASHIEALLANDFRPLLATGRPDDSLLLAAAGAELAAGNREGARNAYVAAARLAERTGNTGGTSRAWQAVGALAKQDRLDEAARIAFARASVTS